MSFVAQPFPNPAEPRLPLPEVPALEEQWDALAQAARAVAVLAGEADICAGDLATLLGGAVPWRRERAAQCVGDLSAIMRGGVAALLAVRERGSDPRAAAGALLYEFGVAQAALRAVLAP